ncbi:sensor histidine kinase [Frankia sp. Cr1]|uniref:sensor histidine kinase n=1 Tax=Frankia sp. Cr1 TaxID=3073931 RepID=UPI002AD274C1|nr:sensor histidine kinase [Frankia sp. Cr1]
MWRSRTLASQILIGVLGILVVTIALGGALYVELTRRSLDRQYETRAVDIAATVAQIPDVRAAVLRPDPQRVIQGLANQIGRSTGADYVVVADRAGVRLSHPNPALIGQRLEEPVVALDGRTHVGIDHGSLGRSANGKAPVFDSDGAAIGEVSVGILERNVTSRLRHEALLILLYSALILALSTVASWALARTIKRITFGLELSEIASLLQEREAMLHGIREGVLGFDANGCVNLINNEARRLLRITSTATGQHLDELVPPGRLHDMLAGDISGADQVALTDEYLLVVNRMPVLLSGRDVGYVVTLRDRTEFEALIRELHAVTGLTAALRAQEHEFANRLHVIAGLLELSKPEEAASYLAEISQTTIGQGEELRARIAPPSIAALLTAKVTIAAEQDVQVIIDDTSHLDQPAMDPQVLITIIGNLINNAVDAVAGEPGPRQVGVHISDDDGEVFIRVTDTGPGVVPDTIEEIFQDGYSTKTPRGEIRRGLGLALIHRLVHRTGGSVTVSPGPGARFEVRLPIPDSTTSTPGLSTRENSR